MNKSIAPRPHMTQEHSSKQALVAKDQEGNAASMLQVIARAASDPNCDLDKMERLLQMQERIMQRQSEMEFNAAMTSAQEKMRPISADAQNPQTKSKYASYAALDKALRPIYIENGFAVSFNTGEGAPADQVRVLCQVSHAQGFSRQYHVDMPADGKGAKGGDVMTKTHAVGAGLSYGMRYLLKMVFNVAIGEADIDGNEPVTLITEDQALTIETLIKDTKTDIAKFLRYLSHHKGSEISTVRDIPAAEFKNAITALEKKRNQS